VQCRAAASPLSAHPAKSLAIAAQIGSLRRMTGMSRTADLGALDYAARCHEGPVWGSRAAAMVILANDRCGPTAIASRWKF
jgi:hypothetical protein